MKILVLNSGSSSVKFQVIETDLERMNAHEDRTLATGLVFGLAMLTKFNAFFLPLVLLVHYGWASRRDFRHPLLAATGLGSLLPLLFLSLAALVAGKGMGWAYVAGGSLMGIYLLRRDSFAWPIRPVNLLAPALIVLTVVAFWQWRRYGALAVGVPLLGVLIWRWRSVLPPLRAMKLMAPGVFFSMLLLGGAVLYLQWPWLWHDTTARFSGYLSYHLEHTFYNTEYLGKNYNLPPFPVEYPFAVGVCNGITNLEHHLYQEKNIPVGPFR